jgi:bacteriocin-like protein
MNEQNKEPMVDRKKGCEEKAQLSEETLNNVSGGLIFAEEPIEYHSKGRVR